MAVEYEYKKGSKKNDTFVVADGQHLEINNKSGGTQLLELNAYFTQDSNWNAMP